MGTVAAGCTLGSGLLDTTSPTLGNETPDIGLQPDSEVPKLGDLGSTPPHLLAWGGSSIYFQRKGFEHGAIENALQSVLDLHVDTWWSTKLDFWRGSPMQNPSQGGWIGEAYTSEHYFEVANRLGYQTMLGYSPSFETFGTQGAPIEWYQNLSESEKFDRPDGGTVDELTELIRVDISGNDIADERETEGEEYIQYYPSIHADGYQEYLSELAEDIGTLGVQGLWIDNVYSWQNQRDFSVWANAAFREYLRELPERDLERLGVQDLEDFDLRSELRDRIPPGSGEAPATDPLYREYVKFDYRAFRSTFANVRESIDEGLVNNEEPPSLLSNLNFRFPGRGAVAVDEMTTAATEYQRTFPPEHIYDFVQKYLVAAGRFEKSGFQLGSPMEVSQVIEAVQDSALDLSRVQPGLLSILLAEEISNRCIGSAHFHGDCCYGSMEEQPMNWLRTDGTIPSELSELTGFASSIEELLRGGQFNHDTAVVMSIPTFMWSHALSWGYSTRAPLKSFMGAARIVRENQHPYDVLLFGHPDVWDDTGMVERLSSYEQIVLPNATDVPAHQLRELQNVLDDGTSVIITDGVPERDEHYEPLADSVKNALFGHPNTTVIYGTAARDYWNGDGNGDELRTALASTPQVSVDTTTPTSITVQTQSDVPRAVVQVVNYGLNHDSGVVEPLTDLSLNVRDNFPFDITNARLYQPGSSSEQLQVDHSDEGRVELTLPEVGPWGVVVLGPSAEAVTMSGSESIASEAIDQAATAIDEATSQNRERSLDQAKTLLSYARTTDSYEAYESASEMAEVAEQIASGSVGSPTVGIDIAHNQPSSGHPYDFFAEFRSAMEANFTSVEAWTPEIFVDLDILIVPPTYENQGGPFGYTDREVRLIESFVDQGGTAFFLGGSNIAADHESVMSQFGLGFVQGSFRDSSEGERAVFRDSFTNLTILAPDITAIGNPTAVANSDGATVLYRYPFDSVATIDTCGESETGEDCKVDAAGLPFSATTTYGDGRVIAYADTRAFKHSGSERFHNVFFEQTLAEFGEHTTRRKRDQGGFEFASSLGATPSSDDKDSDEDGDDGTSDTEGSSDDGSEGTSDSEDSSNDDSDGSGPGFGLGAALTGLGGVGYLLKQRLDDETGAE